MQVFIWLKYKNIKYWTCTDLHVVVVQQENVMRCYLWPFYTQPIDPHDQIIKKTQNATTAQATTTSPPCAPGRSALQKHIYITRDNRNQPTRR